MDKTERDEIYELLMTADSKKDKKAVIKKLKERTKLDHRTVRGLIQIYSHELIDKKGLDIFLNKDFYTYENMLKCYKLGLEDIIPITFYENMSFVRAAKITSLPDNFSRDNDDLYFFTLLEEIKDVGDFAFKGCKNLTVVMTHNHVNSIGKAAFKGCKSITYIHMPNSIKYIGEKAFEDCTSLEKLRFPFKIDYVRPKTFKNCKNLQYVMFQRPIGIGREAFKNCESLEDIVVDIKELGESAFCNCNSMTGMTIDTSIIPKNAFKSCEHLHEISFLRSPMDIKRDAFLGCTNLSSIDVEGFRFNFKSSNGYEELAKNFRVVMKDNEYMLNCDLTYSKQFENIFNKLNFKIVETFTNNQEGV